MRQERIDAALMVAAKLHEAEATINEAITATAELVAVMPTACVRAGLTAAYGQQAVSEAVAAVAALSDARHRIGTSHGKLTAMQRKLGLGTVGSGPGQEKPLEPDPLMVQPAPMEGAPAPIPTGMPAR
jgi:hypothetical protein